MKFFKRAGEYRASNVTFNKEHWTAYSYGWWQFVKVVNGRLVFNSYRYSASTSGHQRKVLQLIDGELDAYAFRQKGISVKVPNGLQDSDWAKRGTDYAKQRIETLTQQIKRGREGSGAQGRRHSEVRFYKEQIAFLKTVKK